MQTANNKRFAILFCLISFCFLLLIFSLSLSRFWSYWSPRSERKKSTLTTTTHSRFFFHFLLFSHLQVCTIVWRLTISIRMCISYSTDFGFNQMITGWQIHNSFKTSNHFRYASMRIYCCWFNDDHRSPHQFYSLFIRVFMVNFAFYTINIDGSMFNGQR